MFLFFNEAALTMWMFVHQRADWAPQWPSQSSGLSPAMQRRGERGRWEGQRRRENRRERAKLLPLIEDNQADFCFLSQWTHHFSSAPSYSVIREHKNKCSTMSINRYEDRKTSSIFITKFFSNH